MKLSLPFAYSITHKKPGEEKSTTSGAISTVTADIPTVSKADVELVADWNILSNRDTIKRSVISWNGDLYRKLGISTELLVSESPTDLEEFARHDAMKRLYGISHWGSNRSKQLLNALSGQDATRVVPKGIPKSRAVVATTLDHERAEAQHMIDGIADIDGEAWHRIPGMMLSLSQVYEHQATLMIGPSPYGQDKADLLTGMPGIQAPVFTRFFDINQQSRALSHVEAESHIDWRFSDLKIHRPDLVAFDGEAEFAARIMNSAVRTNEYRVGKMGDREISLWMQMRDAVARWYVLEPEPLTEHDVKTLYDFCAMTPEPHMNQWPKRGCEILDIYRADRSGTATPKAGITRRP
ncbi:hypothetical protein [Rhizobium sp. BK176]|uniref:hypothetical protein n=1 Tax=Rhizobium sp. BK176 TaxID=2587071 RepID=UPI0021682570|nr:hypothetical protein [Rhizobium sp. BK176]MCS4088571.1 hypothetical protein [Rhizobium sp. BK176]